MKLWITCILAYVCALGSAKKEVSSITAKAKECVCSQSDGNATKSLVLPTSNDEDRIKPLHAHAVNIYINRKFNGCLPGVPCHGKGIFWPHQPQSRPGSSNGVVGCLPGVPCIGKGGQIGFGPNSGFPNSKYKSDCSGAFTGTEGSYMIQIPNRDPFKVYCVPDRNVNDRAWTVVINRFDGSVDFDRPFSDYKKGFGDVDQSYFLVLQILHLMTHSKRYELWMRASNGLEDKHLRYDRFAIGSDDEGYILHTLGQQIETNARYDGLRSHMGMRFSSKDNDYTNNTCPTKYKAGWWFFETPIRRDRDCAESYFTSKYVDGKLPQFTYPPLYTVTQAFMAIREYRR